MVDPPGAREILRKRGKIYEILRNLLKMPRVTLGDAKSMRLYVVLLEKRGNLTFYQYCFTSGAAAFSLPKENRGFSQYCFINNIENM